MRENERKISSAEKSYTHDDVKRKIGSFANVSSLTLDGKIKTYVKIQESIAELNKELKIYLQD